MQPRTTILPQDHVEPDVQETPPTDTAVPGRDVLDEYVALAVTIYDDLRRDPVRYAQFQTVLALLKDGRTVLDLEAAGLLDSLAPTV